jgi:hypothetical protein
VTGSALRTLTLLAAGTSVIAPIYRIVIRLQRPAGGHLEDLLRSAKFDRRF